MGSVELLKRFRPVMLTALISWQRGCVGGAEGRGGALSAGGGGSVPGVPRAGRTGAGQRGLSAEVAEAALKFSDAFELRVKILEIGRLRTLPAGRAR